MMTGTRLARFGFLAILVAAFGAAGIPATAASAAAPAPDETQETKDVVYMKDGRVLHGKIINETADAIVFRYIDPNIRIQSQLTLDKGDVLNVDRDVPVEAARPEPVASEAAEFQELLERRERGIAEGASDDDSLPSLYVIPMKGQMGTDIRLEVYTSIIDDIRKRQPDAVVWVLDCRDVEDEILGFTSEMFKPEERGVFLIDDYRLLVQRLHDDLRGIRQVMWVHDAYGVGSVMALAWPEVYMKPGARLVGMGIFFMEFGGDDDIKAKMREAAIGVGNGFLARGGHPVELGHGLMNPRVYLSASWEGRKVVWRNDLSGEVVINNRDDAVAAFRAKTAEDFGISRGTVETLDDLAMLMGFREYRVMEGDGLNSIVRYRQQWRRDLASVGTRFRDYNQHMGWAGGDQAVTWLGRAKSDLEFIVAAMRRYPAIELRVRMAGGPDRLSLEMQIETLQRQITDLRRQGRGRGGGRGGGGSGGGG